MWETQFCEFKVIPKVTMMIILDPYMNKMNLLSEREKITIEGIKK